MPQSAEFKSTPRSTTPALRIGLPVALFAILGASGWFVAQRHPEPHLIPLPLVRQATPYTCGPAALESILAYYGKEWREDILARELKSDPDNGTNYQEIVQFARKEGLQVDAGEGMTIQDLRRSAEQGKPVIVAIQAWSDHAESYTDAWEDGHYAIVVGVDEGNVYLMDPSTIGNYTFIPIPEFLTRWHDYYIGRDGAKVKLIHFGMVFSASSKPSFHRDALMPLR